MERIGEWHRLTVTLIPEDEDGPAEFDYEIEHLSTCTRRDIPDDDDMYYDPVSCDIAAEIENSGYEGFDITEAGVYQVRFILYQHDYFGDWDGEVEVVRDDLASLNQG